MADENAKPRSWTLNCARCVALVWLAACGPPAMHPGAANVKLMKADPPEACEELGPVRGSGNNYTGNEEGAKVELRNAAAELGANYVRMETVSDYGNTFTGTAYQCPAP
jgi:hypothetical protein